ncbi:hypothetical protein F4808DRAFT_349446 [Astrocystis sublimbata]|nr:hypothetical protein F4808DRAFT_349446 [Astrocystis sublimbata]
MYPRRRRYVDRQTGRLMLGNRCRRVIRLTRCTREVKSAEIPNSSVQLGKKVQVKRGCDIARSEIATAAGGSVSGSEVVEAWPQAGWSDEGQQLDGVTERCSANPIIRACILIHCSVPDACTVARLPHGVHAFVGGAPCSRPGIGEEERGKPTMAKQRWFLTLVLPRCSWLASLNHMRGPEARRVTHCTSRCRERPEIIR